LRRAEEGAKRPHPIASRKWPPVFPPSRFQGVEFNSNGDPVHYVGRPPGVSSALERASVDTNQQLDRRHNQRAASSEIEARITAYETAFRMQASVPDLVDMSNESTSTLEMYGAN